MLINILQYVLRLVRGLLQGDVVLNPAGAKVAQPARVETKVMAAGHGAIIGTLLGGLINVLPIPDWAKKLILLLLPALGATSAAYLAPHTTRSLPS
jgi:hypothetical protein